MNTGLFIIVKQIVAQHGEGILADSARLKSLFIDYAKNEAKEDRVAFGRCIEMGAYQDYCNLGTKRNPYHRAGTKPIIFGSSSEADIPFQRTACQSHCIRYGLYAGLIQLDTIFIYTIYL